MEASVRINNVIHLALVALLVCGGTAFRAEAGLVVTDLRCEYLTDPLGIDAREPRFSWKLVDSSQTRGQKQTAYRIMADGGAAEGGRAKTVLWDSGKLASAESVNNVYGGTALTSNLGCTWKVRVWDKEGTPTEWSTSARFSMGLLEPSDWEGDWIRCKVADEVKHIWYRKNFTLERVPSRAFAYLYSIGYHELFVNGERFVLRDDGQQVGSDRSHRHL